MSDKLQNFIAFTKSVRFGENYSWSDIKINHVSGQRELIYRPHIDFGINIARCLLQKDGKLCGVCLSIVNLLEGRKEIQAIQHEWKLLSGEMFIIFKVPETLIKSPKTSDLYIKTYLGKLLGIDVEDYSTNGSKWYEAIYTTTQST